MNIKEQLNRGASRREFIGGIAAASVLGGCRSLFGEAFKTVTSADGDQTFQFFSTAALEELAFAYAPGEGDTGAALLSAFGANQGLTIILR